MSLSSANSPVSKYQEFQFYGSGTTLLDESINPGATFKLEEIRLKLSSLHPSVVYFRMWLSSIWGSAFNITLVSQLASTITDFYHQPSAVPYKFAYGDTLNFSMPNSDGLTWGLVVSGWAVTA